MFTIGVYPSPSEFLDRAEGWLLEREDFNNLILSLAHGRAQEGVWEPDSLFATVEQDGEVVGCAMRTPPHKVLLSDMPLSALPTLASTLAEIYEDIPGILGLPTVAEAVAEAWVSLRGGGWVRGMEQGIYRLDRVIEPNPVPGGFRVAVEADLDLAIEWGEGFARDAGVQFATRRETVEGWIEREALHIWEVDGVPKSIAVAHGTTPNAARVGYVYTPPEERGKGYASACVAALSQKVLDSGRRFCVLYTDLSNPTSNAIYSRLGYELIAEVRDFGIVSETDSPEDSS